MIQARVWLILCSATLAGAQTPSVKVWQDKLLLPTYQETDPEIQPPFDQLNSSPFPSYPYTVRRGFSNRKTTESWRILNLENEFLTCRILPDLGGRLYSCRDKINGVEMFYANTSVRKSDLGPRGAWISMGIEPSFPVARSRLSVSPVHFATENNADGSASVWVGAVDRVSGMEWRIAYTLHPGQALLEQRVWLYNRGFIRHPYQYWSDASLIVRDHPIRFSYPVHVTEANDTKQLNTWPINQAGVDVSTTANHPDQAGLFAYGSWEPFFGAYDAVTHTGVAHWADPHDVPGKKIWIGGERGNSTVRNTLSDDGTSYVEMQAGSARNQDIVQFLEPQQTVSFTEYWIPTRELSTITRVTPAAVLSLTRNSPGLAFEVNVTEAVPAAVILVTGDGKPIYRQKVDLTPQKTFHAEVPLAATVRAQWDLQDASGKTLLSHQENLYNAAQPKDVQLGPQSASGAIQERTDQDFFDKGSLDERKLLRDQALIEYQRGISAYPNSSKLRVALARLNLDFERFSEAGDELTAGTRNGAAPDPEYSYYLGLAKAGSGDETGAQSIFGAIHGGVFGVPAQLQLAGLLARKGDREKALAILASLPPANASIRARELQVALLRAQGQKEQALRALRLGLEMSPLDSFLRVEATLLGEKDDDLWLHLAADPEWVLDVVDQYFDLGLYEDAMALLSREYPAVPHGQSEAGAVLPQAYPLIAYYRGYAKGRLHRPAEDDFRTGSQQSTVYVFPRRTSSVAVLTEAIRQNPRDATAHYLLSCLYVNSRRDREALAELELAKPASGGIPGYAKTATSMLEIFKKEQEQRQELAKRPSFPEKPTVEKPIVEKAAAPAVAPSDPGKAWESALEFLLHGQIMEAAGVFQVKNFPEEKASPEVRQAYIEVQLQRILALARAHKCMDAFTAIDHLGDEDQSLPFTFYGFGGLIKSARVQYYLGLGEAECGEEKDARKRWGRIAKSSAPPDSPDYAFPLLAAQKLEGDTSKVAAAVAKLRAATGVEQGVKLYNEGMLQRAAGQNVAAIPNFTDGAAASSGIMRYLNMSARMETGLSTQKK